MAAVVPLMKQSLRGGFTTMEEKMPVIINARAVREAWAPGLLDALLLGIHALAVNGRLSDADRTLITVNALRMWPDHAITTMVDRVIMIEDALRMPGGLLRLLADRDGVELLVDALFRPILLAGTLRPRSDAVAARLAEGVRAAGIAPATFGLPG